MLRLVDEGHVDGWDDPRMPTLSGMREEATLLLDPAFCERVGLASGKMSLKWNARILPAGGFEQMCST